MHFATTEQNFVYLLKWNRKFTLYHEFTEFYLFLLKSIFFMHESLSFPYLLLITVFLPWHPNMYNHVNILNSKCMYITIVFAAIQKHVMDNVRVLYHGFRGDEMVIAICAKVKGHAIIICLHGWNSCTGKCQCLKNGICPKEQIKYFYFTTIVANLIQSLWPNMVRSKNDF